MSKLIEVKQLSKYYTNNKGFFHKKKEEIPAVNDISLEIEEQETLGIVGESGCGKSTMGRCILRLHEVTKGEILYRGVNLCNLSEQEMISYRKKMQIIFQNANSAFDPRWTIEQTIKEAISIHEPNLCEEEINKKIDALMIEVGFFPEHKKKYPHEFSGGQRQRLGIAKAISVSPEFIVCDEPVSALDVSVQAQVLNLMKVLQEERKLSYLFISHDLSVIKYISNRVAVMYAGRIVELASTKDFFEHPIHPYSKVLIATVPRPSIIENKETLYQSIGKIEKASEIGCPFCNRCNYKEEICKRELPKTYEITTNHYVACHFATRISRNME